MSLYYSPEIVKLLTAERLREAQEAHRARDRRRDPRIAALPFRVAGTIGRIFVARAGRPTPTPSTCSC
jgi:hypothetical protein